MTDETLKITLSNLRDDLDMLLNAHYSKSENGIAGMKERIASAICNIDTLTTGLNETKDKLTADESTLQECYQVCAEFKLLYKDLIVINDRTTNDIFSNFTDFLNSFLNATEKQNNSTLSEKVVFWSTYLLQLREMLDILNVQDAQNLKNMLDSGSTGGGTVSAELEQKVNQNTANISALQTQVDEIDEKYSKYLIKPDPNYTGKTFTDYPAGTIIQTYDYDERKFNINSTSKIETPKLRFIAEEDSSSTIKISTKFKTLLPATLTICTYLNGTKIDERTETTTDDSLQDYYFEFTSQPLNTDSKGNNIYQTYIYSGSNNTMYLTYQKTEVIASNAMFLNKLCPFNAHCLGNQYYLTDCSSGTLKTATISVDDIVNINSVAWNDTGIPAIECYMETNFTKNSDGTFAPNLIQYFIRHTDHNIYALDPSNLTDMTLLSNVVQLDTVTQGGAGIMLACAMKTGTWINNYFYYPETKKLVNMSSKLKNSDYIMFYGAKLYNNTTTNIPTTYGIAQTPASELSYGSIIRDTNRWQFHSGTNVTMRYYDFVENQNYYANIYIKYYDKLLKANIKQRNDTVTIISTTEFGNYDKVYEMPNDDYFAVKDNKFYYYKLPQNETTTE